MLISKFDVVKRLYIFFDWLSFFVINMTITRIALENAKEIRHKISVDLGRLPESLLPSQYISAALALGRYDGYNVVTSAARTLFSQVEALIGDDGARCYLRVVLAEAIANVLSQDLFSVLPPRIATYHGEHLSRITQAIESDQSWLQIDNDLFLKDFGLATLRLYAAASQLIDCRCGIPRSWALREGLGKAPAHLLVLLRLGGFKPYFQIHTHLSCLDYFNEEGWRECYRACVDLYRLYPESLGMFGSSWFYDPALESISPKLSYLRNEPLSGGARLMFVESGGDAIGNSLSRPGIRRTLYESGKYTPKNYMLVWGRSQQSSWAASDDN